MSQDAKSTDGREGTVYVDVAVPVPLLCGMIRSSSPRQSPLNNDRDAHPFFTNSTVDGRTSLGHRDGQIRWNGLGHNSKLNIQPSNFTSVCGFFVCLSSNIPHLRGLRSLWVHRDKMMLTMWKTHASEVVWTAATASTPCAYTGLIRCPLVLSDLTHLAISSFPHSLPPSPPIHAMCMSSAL